MNNIVETILTTKNTVGSTMLLMHCSGNDPALTICEISYLCTLHIMAGFHRNLQLSVVCGLNCCYGYNNWNAVLRTEKHLRKAVRISNNKHLYKCLTLGTFFGAYDQRLYNVSEKEKLATFGCNLLPIFKYRLNVNFFWIFFVNYGWV